MFTALRAWWRRYREVVPDPCPMGGDHDWTSVALDWESILALWCGKCDLIQRP